MPFTTASWDGSAGRWPDAASYCRSSLVDNNPSGAEKTKSECHFPVKAPGSDVYNVNALRAVVGGRGAQANFPGAEAARARARRLLAEYQGTQRSEEVMEEVKPLYRVAPPSALIFRDDGDEPLVEGMVVPYGQWSEVDSVIEGHFMERFAVGSLRKTFAETIRRVKGYFEHGHSRMFDRTPIMEIRETWETDAGAFFRASLLNGLPEWMIDGIRRGLYGVSLGARPINMERTRYPKASAHNPQGLEERTYRELRASDISLTPAPHYPETVTVFRSISDELAVEQLVQNPERLLQLLREVQEAEPPHSEPDAPDAETPQPPEDPEQVEEAEPVERPDDEESEPEPDDVEASRDTQPPTKDYLSEDEEEAWQL